MKTETKQSNMPAILFFIIGILARILPHPANVSPFPSLSLFGGAKLGTKATLLAGFLVMVFSDILISSWSGFPVFGIWTLFTYSGFAMIAFAGHLFLRKPSLSKTIATVFGSSFGFWLWTNFGVWIAGDHTAYAHTVNGLASCYIAALPFLQNSLAGDAIWGLVFFGGYELAKRGVPQLAR